MNDNGNKFAVLKQWPVSSWQWPRIAVFVPLMPALSYADEIFPHFIEIARQGVSFLYHPYGSTDSVRNRIGEIFLSSNYTHLLMLDADQKHQTNIVQHMARWVIDDPNKLVIAGMYYNRREPYEPMAWVKGEDGALYQVEELPRGLWGGFESAAAGCLLIAREVFQRIKRPWFHYDYTDAERMKERFVFPTEDIGFFKKVRQAGIDVFVDTTIVSPHARVSWVTKETHDEYKAAHARPEETRQVAEDIARFLDIPLDEVYEKADQGSANVRERWKEAEPITPDEVRTFYGAENNGYFFDLLNWNGSDNYQSLVKPLRDVEGNKCLVIGAGIGGEVDALLVKDNQVAIYELPGQMRDFLMVRYKDNPRIRFVDNIANDTYDLVIAIDVIEHIHPKELDGFLVSILWATKPNGVFYCHTNFGDEDLYPMHFPQNSDVYRAWIQENFEIINPIANRRREPQTAVMEA